jgi:hypothetical protein
VKQIFVLEDGCNSVFLTKQQPAALWDLRNDDTYK